MILDRVWPVRWLIDPGIIDARAVSRCVTSGSPAPFLKKNIGMAYVPVESSAPGTQIRIGVRSQEASAKVVPLPFYKRPR